MAMVACYETAGSWNEDGKQKSGEKNEFREKITDKGETWQESQISLKNEI